ncbi:MAG TPA: zinc metalloprotease HtpX, partial [Candidatus Woesebacteria bacterium]|nr:zinc metalloprotease HtpX [Candidatus Woesebacteria bacterium]
MTHYQLVAKNKRRSWLIMIAFVLFVTAVSYVIAIGFDYSLSIVGLALIFSGFTSFFSYYFSDKIVLTISRAKPATRREYFDF